VVKNHRLYDFTPVGVFQLGPTGIKIKEYIFNHNKKLFFEAEVDEQE
jgi:hypothetical protein